MRTPINKKEQEERVKYVDVLGEDGVEFLLARPLDASGEETAGERTPRDHPEALIGAERDHLCSPFEQHHLVSCQRGVSLCV
jgi:hypothetical protein